MKLRFTFCYLLSVLGTLVMAEAPSKILLKEDFSHPETGLAKRLLEHPRIQLAETGGVDGTPAIRAAYVGYEQGSERVVVHYSLPRKVSKATLTFDVLFEEDFQWVRGGKLHGLGPEKPVTGGRTRRPDGWSARSMFNAEGRISSYLYDQDKQKKWGYGSKSKNPVFTINQWHRVEIQVILNDPGEKNGQAIVRIDGKEVLQTRQVEYRGNVGEPALIERFLFSTFHGGNTPDWAPKNEQGEPITVHARFDNFEVRED